MGSDALDMMNQQAQLKRLRSQIGLQTALLGIDTKEMTISHFVHLLDHFYNNPEEYQQITNS